MSLSYRQRGAGPCVVLLHGLAASGAVWTDVVEDLARDHRVVVPDLPGHGRSRVRNGDHSLSAAATGVRDLLVLLGEERATIVGHSLGGGTALYFAYQYPQRCERLVLVAPGGFGTEVHPALRAMALPGAGAVIAAWTALRRRVGRPGTGRGVRLAAPQRRTWRPGVPRFLGILRAVVGGGGQRVQAGEALGVVASAIPTLVVWGAGDRMIPVAHAAAARAAAPAVRLSVLDGVGHCPHTEDPARFVSLLRSHLDGPAGAADDTCWSRLLTAPELGSRARG